LLGLVYGVERHTALGELAQLAANCPNVLCGASGGGADADDIADDEQDGDELYLAGSVQRTLADSSVASEPSDGHEHEHEHEHEAGQDPLDTLLGFKSKVAALLAGSTPPTIGITAARAEPWRRDTNTEWVGVPIGRLPGKRECDLAFRTAAIPAAADGGSLATRSAGSVALATASGDDSGGADDGHPSVKRPRTAGHQGAVTVAIATAVSPSFVRIKQHMVLF
jgi:hypothetical protein